MSISRAVARRAIDAGSYLLYFWDQLEAGFALDRRFDAKMMCARELVTDPFRLMKSIVYLQPAAT